MNPRVLRRFIILLAALIVASVVGTDVLKRFASRPPGDYETEMGSLRLEDGLLDEALAHYDKALEEFPNHRGALMGRALVFINRQDYPSALAALNHLIEYLRGNLEPDDPTGRAVLAAAYANRGIVLDRTGQYTEALQSYVMSLKTDEDTVEGPGIVHKILYESDDVSTVRKRARYLYEQLELPEEQRLMRVPEIDARQRMYKP